uniref:Fanconi-associated nuclease n=1 Tax=Macrostomum lignano TaxID=282301 RepID=A0A1I8HKE7_9PLAT
PQAIDGEPQKRGLAEPKCLWPPPQTGSPRQHGRPLSFAGISRANLAAVPPNSACAPVCTMQSLLSATDSELSDILASISNEDEEEADCDFHSAGQGFDSDLANRGMRQIRLLLARALRVRVRDHLLSEFLRSALTDSLGLTKSGGTVLPAQAAAVAADRSTERDTITAMDAQTPPHFQQLAASSRCRSLLAERLRQVFFPDRCARLLIDSLLAKQLRLCGEALTCPMLTGAADRDNTRRSASSTSTRKPSPPRRQRRRRRSSRQRRQQRRLARRQSRSCSASTPSTLKSVEFALQVDQPELQPAAAAAVVPALNTDGSNSYRQQPQAKQTSRAQFSRGLEDNQHHQQRHRNRHRERNHKHRQHHQHHHHHQHQHHQHQPHQHYQPPPAVTQTSLCQRLCLLHSTPGGFKASLKPSPTASSTCAVCASRHFLLRQLGRMVASRATGQLAELERTLGDCLEQQRRWQRSLQWIASNVKEHRLPGSVRPFVNSCGCSADRSF